jgi:hypothetical protein
MIELAGHVAQTEEIERETDSNYGVGWTVQ